jgi:hypothetical protein
LVSRPVDVRDVPEGRLYLFQLRGRGLLVEAAKFAAPIEREFDAREAQVLAVVSVRS